MLDTIEIKECDLDQPSKGLPSSSNQIKLMNTTFNSVVNYYDKERESLASKVVEKKQEKEKPKVSSVVDRTKDVIRVVDADSTIHKDDSRPLKLAGFMNRNIRDNCHELYVAKDLEDTVIVHDMPLEDKKENDIDLTHVAEKESKELSDIVEKNMNDDNMAKPVAEMQDFKLSQPFENHDEEEKVEEKESSPLKRSDLEAVIDEMMANLKDNDEEEKVVSDFNIPKRVHDKNTFDNVSDAVNNVVVTEMNDPESEKITKNSNASIKMDKFVEKEEEPVKQEEKPVYNYTKMTDEEINSSRNYIGLSTKSLFADPDEDVVIRGGDDVQIVPDIPDEERFVNTEEKVVVDEDIPDYTAEEDTEKDNLSEMTKEDINETIDNTDSIKDLEELKKRVYESIQRVDDTRKRQSDTKKRLDDGRESLRLTSAELDSIRSKNDKLKEELMKKIAENNTFAEAVEEDCHFNENEAKLLNEKIAAGQNEVAEETKFQKELEELLASFSGSEEKESNKSR